MNLVYNVCGVYKFLIYGQTNYEGWIKYKYGYRKINL